MKQQGIAVERSKKDGLWRWHAVARNGRVVADSGQGYKSKRNVRDGLVAANTAFETDGPGMFSVYKTRNRQWSWRLRSRNGRIVADSAEQYHNEEDCLAGAAASAKEVSKWVKKNMKG